MLTALVVIFAITFGVVAGCVALGFGYFKQQQKQQIRSMLRKAEASVVESRQSDLMRPAEQEDVLGKILSKFKIVDRLELLIEQSGSNWTPSKLVIASCVAASVGSLLGYKFHFMAPPQVIALIVGLVGLVAPLLLVLQKRKKTLAEFEKQFPDALDFLSRSMRAGHGFSVALEILAADSPEPLGRAFRRVSNDLALGSSLEAAFDKLLITVPSVDVQFFVSSVVLQQETGGNLGEILTKLAYIIRERFRLKGQVQAVSAHGRVTGLVLLLMPIAVVIFVMLTNPSYLQGLANDPTGRMMIYGAISGQFVGYFVIKRIIDIKV